MISAKGVPSLLCFLALVSALATDSSAQVVMSSLSAADRDQSTAESVDRLDPAQMESAVYQRLSEQSGLQLITVSEVDCDELRCRVAFSKPAVNPRYVDGSSTVADALTGPPWDEYRSTQSSIGTREIAPGVREFVVEFTYIVLEDASDDPRIRARQSAACAGAWARVTELRGSGTYIRTAHEQAAKYLELAAQEIGSAEAERLADALRFGPLARDCYAMPY